MRVLICFFLCFGFTYGSWGSWSDWCNWDWSSWGSSDKESCENYDWNAAFTKCKEEDCWDDFWETISEKWGDYIEIIEAKCDEWKQSQECDTYSTEEEYEGIIIYFIYGGVTHACPKNKNYAIELGWIFYKEDDFGFSHYTHCQYSDIHFIFYEDKFVGCKLIVQKDCIYSDFCEIYENCNGIYEAETYNEVDVYSFTCFFYSLDSIKNKQCTKEYLAFYFLIGGAFYYYGDISYTYQSCQSYKGHSWSSFGEDTLIGDFWPLTIYSPSTSDCKTTWGIGVFGLHSPCDESTSCWSKMSADDFKTYCPYSPSWLCTCENIFYCHIYIQYEKCNTYVCS